jgi:hypothetical protein
MLREALRRAGLRPVQLCVPDTRRAGFDERCRAQCLRVAATDEIDQPLHALMREAAQELAIVLTHWMIDRGPGLMPANFDHGLTEHLEAWLRNKELVARLDPESGYREYLDQLVTR